MFTNLIVLLADKVLKGTEKMTGTQIGAMTIIGLLVVFSALLLLVVFLYCSGSIFKKMNPSAGKKPAAKKAAPAPAKPAPKPAAAEKPAVPAPAPAATTPAPAAASDDEEEVIAVIMAAIAAMSDADGKAYAVRSVKQVTRGGSGRSVWAQAGLLDGTRPF